MSNSQEIKKELDRVKSIDVLANSDGGKIIKKNLRKEILNSIDLLANRYKTASHTELVGFCASLRANIDLLRVLNNVGKSKKMAEADLELALQEEGEVESS